MVRNTRRQRYRFAEQELGIDEEPRPGHRPPPALRGELGRKPGRRACRRLGRGQIAHETWQRKQRRVQFRVVVLQAADLALAQALRGCLGRQTADVHAVTCDRQAPERAVKRYVEGQGGNVPEYPAQADGVLAHGVGLEHGRAQMHRHHSTRIEHALAQAEEFFAVEVERRCVGVGQVEHHEVELLLAILDVFEPIFKETGYRARWGIDHAETISPRNIARIKAMGGGIAIQDRMAFAGEFFVERYGLEAAAHAPPIRQMLDAGLTVGAGTDATRVASYNPWISLYWMVTGKTVGGMQLASPENRLSREEALRLYTVGSAWFSGEEEVKGRIAPGQFADFAILSADYLNVPEEQIPSIESVLTVTGGDVVYSAGPFTTFAPEPLPPVSPAWSPVAAFGGYQT